MKKDELPVITQTSDLLVWILGHTAKFPRNHRYGIGTRIEKQFYDLIESLIKAKFSKEKHQILENAAINAQQIQLLIRIATKAKIFPHRSHRHACSEIQSIIQSILRWRRSMSVLSDS